MAVLNPPVKFQQFDSNGNPLSGGKLYTYAAGTSTPLATYTDAAGGTPNANPVILDSRGEASVWLSTTALYKFVLKDSADTTIWTVDNVGGQVQTADLQDTATVTLGDALVGVKDTITGAAAITLHAYLNLKVKGLKKTFGCVGDGVTDDYTKLSSAVTSSGKIIEIEDATFLTNTNLPVPTCAGIVGWGPKVSILKAGVGVTKVLSLATASTTYLRKLDDFAITGNATASASGIILGDGALYAGLSMRNVNVEDFTGTSAVGIYYRDIVGLTAENIRVSGCTENEVFQQSAVSGCPTTLMFRGGASRTALGIGTRIRQGNDIVFDGRVFESNTNEGWKVFPQAGENALGIVFQDCWHESNWASDTTKYDGMVDGSLGTPYVAVRGRGTVFNSACRSLRFTGANVRSEAKNIIPKSAANAVVIDTSAQVEQDWPTVWDLTSYLTDSTTLVQDTKGQVWTTWTPVLTFATPGNINVVYSVQIGRITRNGRIIKAEYNITTSTFTHTTASGALKITGLPQAAKTLANYNQYGAGVFQGITVASYTQILPTITTGATEIQFHASGSAQALAAMTTAEVPSAGTVILRGEISYEI